LFAGFGVEIVNVLEYFPETLVDVLGVKVALLHDTEATGQCHKWPDLRKIDVRVSFSDPIVAVPLKVTLYQIALKSRLWWIGLKYSDE
jgi:hypothetical protein